MTKRAVDLLNRHLPPHARHFDRCPFTGRTPDQLVQFVDESAAPDRVKAAALRIVRSYGINGQCDPAYIANVIQAELTREEVI